MGGRWQPGNVGEIVAITAFGGEGCQRIEVVRNELIGGSGSRPVGVVGWCARREEERGGGIEEGQLEVSER